MKFSPVLLALVAAASAAPSDSQNLRIIGGHDVESGQFPYQVSLQICDDGCFHNCGATIISDSHILTGASCYMFDTVYTYRVLVGVHRLSENNTDRQFLKVHSWKIHPNFSDDGKRGPYDIAVVRLSQSIRFSDRVQPAKLPLPNDDVKGYATLSGWGSFSDLFYIPDSLQTVTIPVITIAECINALNEISPGDASYLDRDSNMCTSPVSVGGVVGISIFGGPLAQDGEIVGIASWGATDDSPIVFTKVSSYVGWIEEQVEDAMEEAPFKLAYL